MDEKKIIKTDQAEEVSGGVVLSRPNEPHCFMCHSTNIHIVTLRTSMGEPKRFRMTCRDCGYSWIEREKEELK